MNPARPVFLAGRGLACALGESLSACVAQINAAPGSLHRVACGELGHFPLHALSLVRPVSPEDWLTQASARIRQVADEAGVLALHAAPLFVASSSINIGALERGAAWQRDSAFAEVEVLASALDWQGPIYWVNTACTSAINATLAACSLIARGVSEDAIVLGLELPNDFTTRGFAGMQLLSRQHARPLGAGRDGLVLGEAVAVLHLSARPASWCIRSGANVVDGSDPTGASLTAIARCWHEALAGDPVEIIKLQAAGSPLNDQKEIAALDSLALQTAPALLSLKGCMGHSLGASGAAELALLSTALETGLWPSPSCPPDTALAHQLSAQAPEQQDSMLLSILGFGGAHAAIRLERSRPEHQAHTQVPHSRLHARTLVCHVSPPGENWQQALHQRLGERPRRLGLWTELGLWGAMSCLDAAGIGRPASSLLIRISSLNGPRATIGKALSESLASGSPMPFSFLQSQPAQLLAHLAGRLGWQGDARCVTQRSPLALLQLALCELARPGQQVLLGWLEEAHADALPESRWLLLQAEETKPDKEAGVRWITASEDALWQASAFALAEDGSVMAAAG